MPEALISYGTRDFIEAHRLSARRTWRDKKRWALLVVGSILAIGSLTFATDPQKRGEMLPIASVLIAIGSRGWSLVVPKGFNSNSRQARPEGFPRFESRLHV